jgi:hypothetical protein
MPLNRDQILTVPDLPREEVFVPEWDGSVFVKTLSMAESLALSEAMKAHADEAQAGVILAFTLCDEDGCRLFTESDIAYLNGKASGPLVKLLRASERLNKLTSEDVETAAKN